MQREGLYSTSHCVRRKLESEARSLNMARHPEEREDLLREASALVVRAELHVDGFTEPVVVGFRREGAASFYFGENVVYQFNSENKLRRAFDRGTLLKCEQGRLYRLTPNRTAQALELVRHELTSEETQEFLSAARERLQQLHAALVERHFRIIGQVPESVDLTQRIRDWLERLPSSIPLAESPGVVG